MSGILFRVGLSYLLEAATWIRTCKVIWKAPAGSEPELIKGLLLEIENLSRVSVFHISDQSLRGSGPTSPCMRVSAAPQTATRSFESSIPLIPKENRAGGHIPNPAPMRRGCSTCWFDPHRSWSVVKLVAYPDRLTGVGGDCGDIPKLYGPRDGLYRCAPLFIRAWFCLTTPVTSNLY